jgi:hypothetical protein
MKDVHNISGSKWGLLLISSFIIASVFTACDNNTSGQLGTPSETSFTATPLSDNPNKIVVKSTTKDAFMWLWDFGNGTKSKNKTDTVTYIYQGKYTIKLTTFDHGGSDSTSKEIKIASDYQGNNVLKNDGALKPDDWTYLNIPGGGKLDVTYSKNTINFSNDQFSYGAIYQPIQVKAGEKYLFSAHIKGSGMGAESWFEIYFGTSKPQQGSDYLDNKYVSLNTYVPCGGEPFDGDLTKMSCSGNGTDNGGIITFSNSGTVYLVIKAGSNGGTLGKDGITLESISLSKL